MPFSLSDKRLRIVGRGDYLAFCQNSRLHPQCALLVECRCAHRIYSRGCAYGLLYRQRARKPRRLVLSRGCLTTQLRFSQKCAFWPIWWGGFGVFAEWGKFSTNTVLHPTDIVLDERIVEWLPKVGGRPFAVHEPNENRITGVRTKPPKGDVRIFYGLAARI